ncbi:unnamed protein product [Blepharisma stoltei]|uniref:Rab-GAP TBC domain-containing protein n=1 Tax=Blepharisma stoltei TaxID=1481888 RepID=A0AAU9ITF6_9CILI|nr:unnamed protein product [Blepharisma stoltei]
MSSKPYIELAYVKKAKPKPNELRDATVDSRPKSFQFRHVAQCFCSDTNGNSSKITCSESCPLKSPLSCRKAHKWCHIAGVPHNSEALYVELLKTPLSTRKYLTHLDQIEMDLLRTFPDVPYFSSEVGRESLKRVLCAVTKYNIKLGYVQGMNFLAASLLYHTSESQTFWMMLILLDKYELKENFKPDFPGLMRHCYVVDFLLERRLPRLGQHFKEMMITSPMFLTDWCLTLFTRQIPLRYNYKILGNFFKQGWGFFYKLVLLILRRLETRLLAAATREDILSIIKPFQPGDWKEFVKLLKNSRLEKLSWKKLAKIAKNDNIDMELVSELLERPESALEKY